eukprot:TRINITY_DN792_c0_g1_i1.p1 TRINITY_DN792_c0_g1~~TRINITY_DN792_c0_g1_i1.p1  ORF type:complete len:634 (+),score=242.66 TRINITY_DN792_c0_g1_i1:89-1903(+)
MSLTQVCLIPPAPTTARGEPTVLNAWMGPPRGDKGPRVAYGNGPQVYLRKLDSPGEAMVVHRNKHPVSVASCSPSGSYCAAGDKDGNVVVFALDNEDKTVKLEKKVVSGQINDVAWSGDNQRLIAVGDGKEGFAAAFALDGGNTVGDIIGHGKAVLGCDFRKERPFRICTGGSDSVFNWYEGPPFKFKHSKQRENNVNCVRFSPDGAIAVSAGSDKKIVIHDGKTGEPTGEIPCDHKGSVYQVAFSADGKLLLSASADKTVKLWDMGGPSCVKTFSLAEATVDYMQVGCVFAGDKMLSLGLNGDVNLFDQGSDKPVQVLRGHQKTVNCIALGPDGLVATVSSDPAVLIWEAQCTNPSASRRPTAKKMHGSMATGACFVGGHLITGAMDDTIAVTDLASGELTLPGKVSGGVFGIAAVGSSVYVATAKGISVLDPAGGEQGKVACDYTPTCIAAAGELFAVGGKEKKVVIYSAKAGGAEQAGEVTGLGSAVTGVAWSQCGKRLAVCCQGKELGVYDAAGGFSKMDVGVDGSFHSAKLTTVSFSASGERLLSGGVDGKVIVWDLAGKSRLAEQSGAHAGGVNCSAWTADDAFVTGGADGAIRTWKL